MQTAIVRTSGTSGGTAVEKQLDADEDRLIHGVEFSVPNASFDGNDHYIEMEAYLGADEIPSSGDEVSDSTQALGRHEIVFQSANSGDGGVKTTLELSYEAPFEWDEHVTLTLEHLENTSENSEGMLFVYYTEA